MHVTAIIAAGGRGQRFGGAQPKQLLALGGRPILERSVTAFLAHPAIDEVVVALPADLVGRSARLPARAPPKPLRVVAGGERRQDSVANAFRAVAASRAIVIVIHDAARPFVSADLIARTIAAAAESGAALAALPARDTVKRARSAAARTVGPAVEPDRSCARRCRARRSSSRRRRRRSGATCCAMRWRSARTGVDATDEAALAERAGHRGAPRRGRGDEHQDHDAGRSAAGRGDCAGGGRPPARDRCASAPATTCIGSSRAGR